VAKGAIFSRAKGWILVTGICVKTRDHSPAIEPLELRIAPATFVVSNLMDSGMGSLRYELQQADMHGGKNTIVFHLAAPAAHTENVITLTSGVLSSKGDVTIIGPGAGKLIVNGNSASGVFSFG
jgi:hypothetical protein